MVIVFETLGMQMVNLLWHRGSLATVPAVLYMMLQCTLRQAFRSSPLFLLVAFICQHLRLLYYVLSVGMFPMVHHSI